MSPAGPHFFVVVDGADKRSELGGVGRPRHGENSLDFFTPRFKAFWGEPVPEPIGFFDTPAALEWIAAKAIGIKAA
eukprot:scaffold248507_cov78-Cyclotella_meneghiniana.AAC.2